MSIASPRTTTSLVTFVNETESRGNKAITPAAAHALTAEIQRSVGAGATVDVEQVVRDAFTQKYPNDKTRVSDLVLAFVQANESSSVGKKHTILDVRLPFEDKPIGQDLAGDLFASPSPKQMQQRIADLVARYLATPTLGANLGDLKTQFDKGNTRQWERMSLHKFSPEEVQKMVVGVDPILFAAVAAQAANIEDPIGEYAKSSEAYMKTHFPPMAHFMANTWAHEERRHMGVLKMAAEKITGNKIVVVPNIVAPYTEIEGMTPADLAYKHALSRTATEWAAASMYLWLMAHSTGPLQQAIAQPVGDEINHLSKFLGYTKWAYGNSFLERAVGSSKSLGGLVGQQSERKAEKSPIDLGASLLYGPEVASVFLRVIKHVRDFDNTLTPELLNGLFGESPLKNQPQDA
jgi:hypothetical protein